MNNTYAFSPCSRNEINATDLRAELAAEDAFGRNPECAFGSMIDADGNRSAERFEVVFMPYFNRAGIAWGADAQWTDANSIEQAIDRFISGDMVN